MFCLTLYQVVIETIKDVAVGAVVINLMTSTLSSVVKPCQIQANLNVVRTEEENILTKPRHNAA
jgi:hypothetical protein